MNIEEILAEVRKGRIAIDKNGSKWIYKHMLTESLEHLEELAPWSLDPITKEISLEMLERAWKNYVDHFRQPNFEDFKKELGF